MTHYRFRKYILDNLLFVFVAKIILGRINGRHIITAAQNTENSTETVLALTILFIN